MNVKTAIGKSKLLSYGAIGMRNLVDILDKNKTKIALTAAIVGVPTTGYLSFTAGLKASDILREKREDLEMTDPDDKDTKRQVIMETVKEMAPIVTPPVISAIVTEVAIISGHKFALAAQAGLSAACKMAEDALDDYKKQTREVVGDEKADEIDRSVAEKRFTDCMNAPDGGYIIETGFGDQLFQDFTTGLIYRSSINAHDKNINILNRELLDGRYVTFGEYLDINHLPSYIGCAEELGWNADWGMVEPIYEPIALSSDETAFSVRFRVGPKAMYRDRY